MWQVLTTHVFLKTGREKIEVVLSHQFMRLWQCWGIKLWLLGSALGMPLFHTATQVSYALESTKGNSSSSRKQPLKSAVKPQAKASL